MRDEMMWTEVLERVKRVMEPPAKVSWWRRLLGMVMVLALFGGPLFAQAPQPNQPFKVLANHTGADADSFRLKIDGVVNQTKPVSALVAGVVTFDVLGGLPAGNHTFIVEAVGVGGTTPSGAVVVNFVLTPAPAAPTNVRIVIG